MTCVAPADDRSGSVDAPPITPRMDTDLAPLRHAHGLLQVGRSVTDVIDELRWLFALCFVDAMAAVAACIALTESGYTVPDEAFARPFV